VIDQKRTPPDSIQSKTSGNLRGNKLAITVFDDYDDMVDKVRATWNLFADDPKRIASITTRSWATVNP
jgi:hypothetical protein